MAPVTSTARITRPLRGPGISAVRWADSSRHGEILVEFLAGKRRWGNWAARLSTSARLRAMAGRRDSADAPSEGMPRASAAASTARAASHVRLMTNTNVANVTRSSIAIYLW